MQWQTQSVSAAGVKNRCMLWWTSTQKVVMNVWHTCQGCETEGVLLGYLQMAFPNTPTRLWAEF